MPDACALKSLFVLHIVAEEQIQLDSVAKAGVMPMPAFGQRMETILSPGIEPYRTQLSSAPWTLFKAYTKLFSGLLQLCALKKL